jgi:hypothetical protein
MTRCSEPTWCGESDAEKQSAAQQRAEPVEARRTLWVRQPAGIISSALRRLARRSADNERRSASRNRVPWDREVSVGSDQGCEQQELSMTRITPAMSIDSSQSASRTRVVSLL